MRTWLRGCLVQPLSSLTMLIEDEGRTCTAAEYEQSLTETGFRQPRRVSLNAPGANADITSVPCAAAGNCSAGGTTKKAPATARRSWTARHSSTGEDDLPPCVHGSVHETLRDRP